MSILAMVGRTASFPRVLEPLTVRELVVLGYLAQDATLAEIAATLWVSRNTVKSQVRGVYRKIGVSTRADAVAWAEAAGLCPDLSTAVVVRW